MTRMRIDREEQNWKLGFRRRHKEQVHDRGRQKPRQKRRRIDREEQDWRWVLKRHKERKKAALLRSESHCAEEEDEEQSTLPMDLILQHILVRLPVRKLLQLRCVCKRWNAMLAWGGSPMEFPQHEEEEYWFVMRFYGSPERLFVVHSSHQQSLFCLPLLSNKLLSSLGGLYTSRLAAQEEFACPQLIATAGGLMCALVHAERDLDVIVFNCLTGSVKVLPARLCPKELSSFLPPIMYMAVDDQDPCRYYVMLTYTLLSTSNDLSYTEVFDSRTGNWKVAATTTMKSSALKVPSGDFFHFRYPNHDKMNVLAYHVTQNAWSAVQVPFKCAMHCPHFQKYKGRFFQACFLDKDPQCLDFGVWELQFTSSETGTWVEVSRTPKHLVQLNSRTHMTLEAEGGLFYTRSYNEEGPMAPLVYDISKNFWYVPDLPLEIGLEFRLVHRPRLSMFFC